MHSLDHETAQPWELIPSSPGDRPGDGILADYFIHFNAPSISTDIVIGHALRKKYPAAHITSVPVSAPGATTLINLLAYAQSGNAELVPDRDPDDVFPAVLTTRNFRPAAKRLESSDGNIVENVLFGRYRYEWQGKTWLMYYVSCRDSPGYPQQLKVHFLLSGEGVKFANGDTAPGGGEVEHTLQDADDSLIRAATLWNDKLHNAIWVFNSGVWHQDQDLYKNIMKSRWEDVILDKDIKEQLQNDVTRFFDGQNRYARLRVPWKRGVIYYGPPGNGKTITIKAMMRTFYKKHSPSIPALYVRSLASYGGPEYAVQRIFEKARQTAPCLLVFEDLDSLVTPAVRSYFLNEVDGLAANDGVLMIGSTNHLDQLDPGIAKRPSRFDRKFLFDKPNLDQRTLYAQFWRKKLTMPKARRDSERGVVDQVGKLELDDRGDGDGDVPDIEFPEALCPKIASITDGFSFAYMQEAFVASLLAIAAEDENVRTSVRTDDGGDLEQLRLWKEIKKEVRMLREEM